jgi:hypothetical protein
MTNMEKYGGWIGLALLCAAFVMSCFWQSHSVTFGNVLLFMSAIFAATMGVLFIGTKIGDWLNKEAK